MNINGNMIKNLTESEKSIYKFLSENHDQIFSISINEIAKKVYVSPATISRFVKKMGFNNLLEFRSYFFNLNNTNKKIGNLIIKKDEMIRLLKSHEDILNNFITYFKSENTWSTLANLLISINNAKQIILIGKGTSQIPVIALENELINKGINAININNTEILLQKINRLTEKDLVIIFSASGTSAYNKFLLKNIQNNSVNMIMITSNKDKFKNIQTIYIPNDKTKKEINLSSNIIQLNFISLLSNFILMK